MYGDQYHNIRQYKTFDFFQGYLKASLILGAVITAPGLLMVYIAAFLEESETAGYSAATALLYLILVLLAMFSIVHFIGGKVARKRKEAYDREVWERAEYERRRNQAS